MESSKSCLVCSCVFPDGRPALRVTHTLSSSPFGSYSLAFDVWYDDIGVLCVTTQSPDGVVRSVPWVVSFCPACGRPLRGLTDG